MTLNMEKRNSMILGEQLRAAADRGDYETLKTLCTHPEIQTFINSTDKHGQSAVGLAAEHGHLSCIKLLLEQGANVDPHGAPLYGPAYWGHLEVLEFLLQHLSLLPDAEYSSGLFYAALRGHLSCVKLLHEHGADIMTDHDNGWTPLIAASNQDHDDVTLYLLQCISKLSKTRQAQCIEWKDESGCTAVWCAAYWGNVTCVKLLVDHGADLNTVDNDGVSPLIASCKYEGNDDTTEFLLQPIHKLTDQHRSEYIDRKDNRGRSALWWAASNNLDMRFMCVKLLVDHGADVNTMDSDGMTPLMMITADAY